MAHYTKVNWFKKTYPDGSDGGYLKRSRQQVYDIRQAQQFNKAKGYEPIYTLTEAPFWYAPYRYIKDNFFKLFCWFVGIMALLSLIILALSQ